LNYHCEAKNNQINDLVYKEMIEHFSISRKIRNDKIIGSSSLKAISIMNTLTNVQNTNAQIYKKIKSSIRNKLSNISLINDYMIRVAHNAIVGNKNKNKNENKMVQYVLLDKKGQLRNIENLDDERHNILAIGDLKSSNLFFKKQKEGISRK